MSSFNIKCADYNTCEGTTSELLSSNVQLRLPYGGALECIVLMYCATEETKPGLVLKRHLVYTNSSEVKSQEEKKIGKRSPIEVASRGSLSTTPLFSPEATVNNPNNCLLHKYTTGFLHSSTLPPFDSSFLHDTYCRNLHTFADGVCS